jgi:hypothetical protein
MKEGNAMRLEDFLESYGGNACISIQGYCEEENFDCYTGLTLEPWWDEIKDREITHWSIIGGGCYSVELCIELER